MDTTNYSICFYKSSSEIGSIEPYAVFSSHEVAFVFRLFDSCVNMVNTHPDLLQEVHEGMTTYQEAVTTLHDALTQSVENGSYPNVLFPEGKLATIKAVLNAAV